MTHGMPCAGGGQTGRDLRQLLLSTHEHGVQLVAFLRRCWSDLRSRR